MRWLLALAVTVAVAAGLFVIVTGGEAERPDLTAPTPAGGAGTSTVAISPVRSLVTTAESDVRIPYSLGNPSRVPRTYRITVAELAPDGTPLSNSAQSAARWAVPTRSEVTVPAGKSASVEVRVRPPEERGSSERRIGVSFTDAAPSSTGSLAMATRVTTSVYVEGTGPAVREIKLTSLELPRFGSAGMTVRADLTNTGTMLVVPGSGPTSILGTMSGAKTFSLAGDVARPGEQVPVVGVIEDAPVACWCQVRVSATSGDDQVTALSGRVLILPWWWVLGVLVAFVVAATVLLARRRWPPRSQRVGVARPRDRGGVAGTHHLERALVVLAVTTAAVMSLGAVASANEPADDSMSTTVTVTRAPTPGLLPDTGGVSVWLVVGAGGLLAGGLVLVASGAVQARAARRGSAGG